MMSVVRSDGYALIDQNSEGIEMNEKVLVRLNPGHHDFKQSLVMIGSHDMMIDVAQDYLAQHSPEHLISSSHVGSFGGLMALKRKECHLAPIHLLGSDGIYNREALIQLFKTDEIVLIKGVQRIQGLLVAKGNPLNIKRVEDLTRIHYVNRQRGAGTRVLLDHLLKAKGIDPTSIKGYEHELSTHLAVASAIQNRIADCGMGVYSAAHTMGCDFIEIAEEAYDFACRVEDLNHPSILRFIQVLKNPEFQASVLALGGYRFDQAGEVNYFGR
jgi:putative molybdopterin biosynthesis protein